MLCGCGCGCVSGSDSDDEAGSGSTNGMVIFICVPPGYDTLIVMKSLSAMAVRYRAMLEDEGR